MVDGCVFQGMNDDETAALTDAMMRSGIRIDLSDIPGIKLTNTAPEELGIKQP
ncbi:MAG: hypothetical protein IPL08_18090 [Saprospiraceae bacterium]|nr:hypothetical protein [Saprospiraceae bacterium]